MCQASRGATAKELGRAATQDTGNVTFQMTTILMALEIGPNVLLAQRWKDVSVGTLVTESSRC